MSGLLLGLISLIIFALLDTFASLNVALIALAVATIIECIYSVIVFGTLDSISLLSIALVIVLALLAYKQQSSLMIKLKPAILNGCLGIFFLFHSVTGQPLLNKLLLKYPQLAPADVSLILTTPVGQAYFGKVSLYFGYALLFHAGLVSYTGIKLNNFWWGITSTFGFFVVMGISVYLASFF